MGRKRIYGSDTDHPHIARSMNNLAGTHGKLGQHEEALAMQKDVLEMRKRIYGSDTDHPEVAILMNNLATTCGYLGLFDEGMSYAEGALVMFEAMGHHEVDYTRKNLEALRAAKDSAPRNEVKSRLQLKLEKWKQEKAEKAKADTSSSSTSKPEKDQRSIDELMAFLGEGNGDAKQERGNKGKKEKKKKKGGK